MSTITVNTDSGLSPEQTLGAALVLDEAAVGAVSTHTDVDSADRHQPKRKKDRLKTCPECGLKAGSNRQLKCRGEYCEYVYRVSERRVRPRLLVPEPSLVVPEPSPVPLANFLGDDGSFEELDEFFKGFEGELQMPLDDIGVNFFDDEPWKCQTKGICV